MATIWGMTPRQLRRAGLTQPDRGVLFVDPPESVAARCKGLSLVLEMHAFSHVTAAVVLGLPVPTALADATEVHVIRPERDGAVRRPDVIGHRGFNDREVIEVDGIPVTGLADTWVDFGELIRPGVPLGLDDLIILGDAVAQRLGSVEPLRVALERRIRPRGKLTLLEALDEIRVGSESPGETRTRLVLTRAGLAEPELNVPIYSAAGVRLGRPDLRYTEARVAIEYQGQEFHGSDDARAADAVRFAGFRQEGWTVVDVWADHLNSDEAREAFVREIARLLGVPEEQLRIGECHPRFFSNRMLELGEIRLRRLRARSA